MSIWDGWMDHADVLAPKGGGEDPLGNTTMRLELEFKPDPFALEIPKRCSSLWGEICSPMPPWFQDSTNPISRLDRTESILLSRPPTKWLCFWEISPICLLLPPSPKEKITGWGLEVVWGERDLDLVSSWFMPEEFKKDWYFELESLEVTILPFPFRWRPLLDKTG